MDRMTAETIRQLGVAADIRPDEAQLPELAQSLNVLLAAIERCDALDLVKHEPSTRFDASGGTTDAQL
jgi:Asp-tRNA(Asn)/Glu-tRNA(Gln) amidotransferase C subunit